MRHAACGDTAICAGVTAFVGLFVLFPCAVACISQCYIGKPTRAHIAEPAANRQAKHPTACPARLHLHRETRHATDIVPAWFEQSPHFQWRQSLRFHWRVSYTPLAIKKIVVAWYDVPPHGSNICHFSSENTSLWSVMVRQGIPSLRTSLTPAHKIKCAASAVAVVLRPY